MFGKKASSTRRIILLLTLYRQSFLLFWGWLKCRFNEYLRRNICTTMMLILMMLPCHIVLEIIFLSTHPVSAQLKSMALSSCNTFPGLHCYHLTLTLSRVWILQWASREGNKNVISTRDCQLDIYNTRAFQFLSSINRRLSFIREAQIERKHNHRLSIDVIWEWYTTTSSSDANLRHSSREISIESNSFVARTTRKKNPITIFTSSIHYVCYRTLELWLGESGQVILIFIYGEIKWIVTRSGEQQWLL